MTSSESVPSDCLGFTTDACTRSRVVSGFSRPPPIPPKTSFLVGNQCSCLGFEGELPTPNNKKVRAEIEIRYFHKKIQDFPDFCWISMFFFTWGPVGKSNVQLLKSGTSRGQSVGSSTNSRIGFSAPGSTSRRENRIWEFVELPPDWPLGGKS